MKRERFEEGDIERSVLTPMFNFKFWKPVDCIGGRIFFGSYYEHYYQLKDGSRSETVLQTPLQVQIKRSSGIF